MSESLWNEGWILEGKCLVEGPCGMGALGRGWGQQTWVCRLAELWRGRLAQVWGYLGIKGDQGSKWSSGRWGRGSAQLPPTSDASPTWGCQPQAGAEVLASAWEGEGNAAGAVSSIRRKTLLSFLKT